MFTSRPWPCALATDRRDRHRGGPPVMFEPCAPVRQLTGGSGRGGRYPTPPPGCCRSFFLLFGIEACWSCSAGFHVVALFAQSSSELRVVRIESHVYEFDSLVWIMIRDCAWFSAEPLVFAAASVLGVAGACAVWVSCEHLPAKRLMSLGVVWVASTGTGAVPLGSGAGVAFACRCLDEVRTSGCRADSPAHVCLAVIVSVGVSWCPRLAYL